MATALSEGEPVERRSRKRLWFLLGAFVVGLAGLGSIRNWRDEHAFMINATDSLPNWAFLIHLRRLPARGEYVFFDPPRNGLVKRHFGAKPRMFGKIAYGLPGDVVTHHGSDVRVNDVLVGRMKPRTRIGEILTPGPTGQIPRGCYYVGTPHLDSFDSRYAEIGFVCARQIVGVGEPVL